jgi:phenylacetic acid degradation operon negative regulatory protein
MRLTAKSIVLDLLSAARPRQVSARELIAACRLFGVGENSVRVALARLSAAGTVDATARGAYRIGAAGLSLTRQVVAWRDVERRVRRWDGGWVCVASAELRRSDRVGLRRRTRALRLLGLRELVRGLELRPDNLDGGVAAVRDRLHALGLEREAMVFRADGFDHGREARARALWDGEALSAGYRRRRARLVGWMARRERLSPEAAARESFLLGGEAIRHILFDPLLPAPLLDVGARRAFVTVALRFDAVGRRVWRELGQAGSP